MRILYIAGERVPGIDGGGVHVWEVGKGLGRLGNDVTLIVRKDGGQKAFEKISGIKIRRLPMRFFGRTIPLMAAAGFYRFAAGKYDVIIERYVTLSGLGMMLSRRLSIPLVLEVNSPHLEEFIWRYKIRNPFIKDALGWWVDKQFDQAQLVISPLLSIVPLRARAKTKEMHWGANVDSFDPSHRDSPETRKIMTKHGLKGKITVIFSGSFRRWHGTNAIPLIARYVTDRNRNVRFLLIGSGDEETAVRGNVRRLGLEDFVIFGGRLPYERVPFFIAAADIGIAPYNVQAYPPLRQFGFYWSPLKVFEYMAMGLPVVVPRINFFEKHLAEAIVFTDSDTPEGMGEAILRLAEDPSFRLRIGSRGRALVLEKFSWRKHCEILNKMLSHLIG